MQVYIYQRLATARSSHRATWPHTYTFGRSATVRTPVMESDKLTGSPAYDIPPRLSKTTYVFFGFANHSIAKIYGEKPRVKSTCTPHLLSTDPAILAVTATWPRSGEFSRTGKVGNAI